MKNDPRYGVKVAGQRPNNWATFPQFAQVIHSFQQVIHRNLSGMKGNHLRDTPNCG